MADRVLPPFDERLSAKALEQLGQIGVEVRTGAAVTAVDETGVRIGDEHIPASTVVWASGVRPSSLAAALGVPLERGSVRVEPDCSIQGHPEVFAIGDIAHLVPDKGDGAGQPLPGLAPVAMQQGRHVARQIRRDLADKPREPFRYRDKGMMATIGRSRAVAQARGVRLSGLLAWLAWIVVHIWYLIGFRNRVVVMFDWFWSYLTFKRGARLITHSANLGPGPKLAEAPISRASRSRTQARP
jgi:NADH dehydrogenase